MLAMNLGCDKYRSCEHFNKTNDMNCLHCRKKKAYSNRFITEERIKELATRPIVSIDLNFIDNIKKGLCTSCGTNIESFKDEKSLKEYRISGMCQSCQNSVFGVD